jgi:hypothetical protein
MFNQELTPPEPRPNLILFDLLHCYKKFIHAAGDHHWSRQNIRLVRTIRKPAAVRGMPAPTDGHNRKDASYSINTSIIRGVCNNRDTSSRRDISTVGKPEGHFNDSK